MKKTLWMLQLVMTLLLAACAPAAGSMDKSTDDMMEKPAEAMVEKPTDAIMEEPAEAVVEGGAATLDDMVESMVEAPAWLSASLTDVRTGEAFTIAGYNGSVVLVETLAMWCSNCKKQQGEVKALHEALGMEKDLVTIGLDIDPNENAADLKAYIENNGFDWGYAVAPPEVSREIGSLYGDQFLNPPSTPMLVIDRKGQVHTLPFGIKSVEKLQEYLEPFLGESM